MVDTLISVKIILAMLLGFLILNEIFVSIQTAEVDNFAAGRSRSVGLNPSVGDNFYNQNIFQRMIFTKDNPFFSIDSLRSTTKHSKTTTSTRMNSDLLNLNSYATSIRTIRP